MINNKNKNNSSINENNLFVMNRRLFILIFALFLVSNFIAERKQIKNYYSNNENNAGLAFSTEAAAAAEEEEDVTTTGIINITVNMELLKSRLSELSFYYHKFSFVHISKCAGSSWVKEISELLPFAMPKRAAGVEFSVSYQKKAFFKKIPPNEVKLMTSFKHPRAHIWSLWGECIFDRKWRGHDEVPYNSTMSYEYNFESWLNHFLYVDNNNGETMQYTYRNNYNTNFSTTTFVEFQTHDYKCYHPANFQSRHLTAPESVKIPHGVTELPNNEYKFEPNIDEVRTVRDTELDWISISEFFHESKCLLYHRLYKSLSNITTTNSTTTDEIYKNIMKTEHKNVVEEMKMVEEKMKTAIKDIPDYLNRHCRCDNPPPEADAKTTKKDQKKIQHVQHYSEGKRKTFLDLPQDLIQKMDWFIKIDTINYRESLIEFLLEIANLEYELGRRVLCDTTISKWEDELSYIGLPDKLSNIYKWAQKRNVINNDTTSSTYMSQ